MEEGLQQLRHQRENERGQAKAEWKNHILVKTASPTEAKEAAIDGDVEVGILERSTLPNDRGKEGPPHPGPCPSGSGECRETSCLVTSGNDGPPSTVLLWD